MASVINGNNLQITELTIAGRGSVRFGTMIGRPGVLYMFVGPLPDVYRIGAVQPERRRATPSRTQMGNVARDAQRIVEQVYDLPPEIRGSRFEDVATWVSAALGVD